MKPTYYIITLKQYTSRKMFFRGWSQAEKYAEDPKPLFTVIENDSRIELIYDKKLAESYAKLVSPNAKVEQFLL